MRSASSFSTKKDQAEEFKQGTTSKSKQGSRSSSKQPTTKREAQKTEAPAPKGRRGKFKTVQEADSKIEIEEEEKVQKVTKGRQTRNSSRRIQIEEPQPPKKEPLKKYKPSEHEGEWNEDQEQQEEEGENEDENQEVEEAPEEEPEPDFDILLIPEIEEVKPTGKIRVI